MREADGTGRTRILRQLAASWRSSFNLLAGQLPVSSQLQPHWLRCAVAQQHGRALAVSVIDDEQANYMFT